MKMTDVCATNSTREKPSDLVKMYIEHEENGGTVATFLTRFEFESREEIGKAVRDLAFAIVGDRWVSDKYTQETLIRMKCLCKRFQTICTNPDKFDKYPMALSGELWHGGYSRKRVERAANRLHAENTPTDEQWLQTVESIKRIYQLTDTDIDKIRFFVCQCRAGEDFPNSLRRMLYIWGNAKMTGKTTVATMIVSILNGDEDWNNIARYSTSLAYEMQIRSFAVPKISECNACLMDECFYADMGKTYADFKRFITSSGGTARLPFGQEFAWSGYPNYIATSNDPLQRFIKDWNDRRYLSVEFKNAPAVKLTFEDIFSLWKTFVCGCKPLTDWKTWSEIIANTSNEIGERQERSTEFEIELKRSEFLDYIISKVCMSDRVSSSDNHISLKFFVDYFAAQIGATEAQKRREEIEHAVLNVYGERYSTQTYWLLSELKKRAEHLKKAILYGEDYVNNMIEEKDEELMF